MQDPALPPLAARWPIPMEPHAKSSNEHASQSPSSLSERVSESAESNHSLPPRGSGGSTWSNASHPTSPMRRHLTRMTYLLSVATSSQRPLNGMMFSIAAGLTSPLSASNSRVAPPYPMLLRKTNGPLQRVWVFPGTRWHSSTRYPGTRSNCRGWWCFW